MASVLLKTLIFFRLIVLYSNCNHKLKLEMKRDACKMTTSSKETQEARLSDQTLIHLKPCQDLAFQNKDNSNSCFYLLLIIIFAKTFSNPSINIESHIFFN